MVKKSLNYNPDWEPYRCRVLKFYETYEGAETDIDKARVTSDLSELDTSRKRKKPKLQPTLPVHPNAQEEVMSSAVNIAVHDNDDCIAADEELPLFTSREVEAAGYVNNVIQDNLHGQSSVELREGWVPQNPPKGDVLACEESSPSCNLQCESFQKDVLMKLQMLEEGQKHQTELLRCISRSLSIRENCGDRQGVDYEFERGLLPIKILDNVVILEEILASNGDAYQKLVGDFNKTGGSTLEQSVKLMLKSIISDDVLAGHCYKGQSKKKAFSLYPFIIKALFEATTSNVLLKATKKDEFDQAMMKNLKQASDRLNQRRKNADSSP